MSSRGPATRTLVANINDEISPPRIAELSDIPLPPVIRIKSEFELIGNACYSFTNVAGLINPEFSLKLEETIDIEDSVKDEFDTEQEMLKNETDDIKTIYKCCNRTFDDEFSHFSHMIYHVRTKLSRFSCRYCHRTFIVHRALVTHVKNMHIGHRCRYCGLIFDSWPMWSHHLKLAHNVYPPKRKSKKKEKKVSNMSKKTTKVKLEIKSEGEDEPSLANVKIESTLNVKIEPTLNVKIEPTIADVKVEPEENGYSEQIIANIKIEPLITNFKTERTD